MAIELTCGSARADIRPECGGTVDALELVPGGNRGAVAVLAGDNPVSACSVPGFRGRFLAPWNDRIPGGTYCFEGSDHRLSVIDPVSGDAMHGFLYRTGMSIDRHDPGREQSTLDLSVSLSEDDEPGYPFELQVQMRYVLRPDTLTVGLAVQNVGREIAPVTVGWHPYFTFPDLERIDGVSLRIGASHCVPVDTGLLPIAERGPIPEDLDFSGGRKIGGKDIDLAYITPAGHTTEILDGRYVIALSQSSLFGYVQVYTPPDRRSVAIEPISGATNAFNRPNLGLRKLPPGESLLGTIEVALRFGP